jgi:hypothetical protein
MEHLAVDGEDRSFGELCHETDPGGRRNATLIVL